MCQQLIDKLIDFLSREKDKINHNLIYKKDRDYYIFGTYRINLFDKNQITVFKRQEFVAEFYSVSSALAWCIADKHGQIELAKNIKYFDSNQKRLVIDLESVTEIARRHKKNKGQLLDNKLDTKREKLALNNYQLQKTIIQAKYLQQKGFYYEAH